MIFLGYKLSNKGTRNASMVDGVKVATARDAADDSNTDDIIKHFGRPV
jgi:hypothetical protein